MRETLRIGEVASRAGVNIQTLRYYERRGLLKEPARHYNGQREYDPGAVEFIRAIKRAQGLGFTLDEIAALLRVKEGRNGEKLAVAASAREKLREVDTRIDDLLMVRSRLERVVSRGCDSITECSCGECPLDGEMALAPAAAGPDGDQGVGLAGSRESEDSGKAAKSDRKRGLAGLLPIGGMAAAACLVCFLPALLAGGFGVAALSVVAEASSVEVGAAAALGSGGGLLLGRFMSRRGHGHEAGCGCAS